MLIPVPMVRVQLLVLDRDLVALSERIGDVALLHPMDARELGPWAGPLAWSEMDSLAAGYASAARRLNRLAEFLRVSGAHADPEARIAPSEVLQEAERLVNRVEPAVKGLEDRLHDLQGRQLRLEALQAQLEMLSDLDVDLAELRRLRFVHMVSGLVPPENVPRLDESLREIPHALIRVRRVGDRELLFAFSLHDDAEVLDRALQSAYVERMEIPAELSGRPAQALAQLEASRGELAQEAQGVERERELLGERWAGELRRARVGVDTNARVVDLWRRAGRTERTRLLAGWVPRARSQGFGAEVAAATEGRALLTMAEPSPTEDAQSPPVPTALANPSPLRPFEGLTRTYGLPDYWDLDPTPLAAALYVLMFGAMFGDLGQGAVLALVGAALARGRILEGQRDFGRVLAACGVSAMIFGILYGSVFASEELIPALWLRPMEDPVLLIGVAIAFGVAVLSIGLVFGIASAWRRHDLEALFLGQYGLVGLWLYWGLLAVVFLVVAGRQQPSLLVIGPLVGVPLALLFLHGPLARILGWTHGAGDGAYAIESGVETFDLVVRFASNTVSFLRIGAFALAHASLGLTVYAIAELVHGLPGAYVATVILGNGLILVLEALIVGIQALRLEYYEFFSKFLRGGGSAFQPFALSRHRAGRIERED